MRLGASGATRCTTCRCVQGAATPTCWNPYPTHPNRKCFLGGIPPAACQVPGTWTIAELEGSAAPLSPNLPKYPKCKGARLDRAPPPGVLQPDKGRAQQRRKALATQPGQLRLRRVVQVEDVYLCSGAEAASKRWFLATLTEDRALRSLQSRSERSVQAGLIPHMHRATVAVRIAEGLVRFLCHNLAAKYKQ